MLGTTQTLWSSPAWRQGGGSDFFWLTSVYGQYLSCLYDTSVTLHACSWVSYSCIQIIWALPASHTVVKLQAHQIVFHKYWRTVYCLSNRAVYASAQQIKVDCSWALSPQDESWTWLGPCRASHIHRPRYQSTSKVQSSFTFIENQKTWGRLETGERSTNGHCFSGDKRSQAEQIMIF